MQTTRGRSSEGKKEKAKEKPEDIKGPENRHRSTGDIEEPTKSKGKTQT